MAKKTRTELSTSAINTNLPDNTQELITPTTERAQLTDERESVINYKDDLGGAPNAGKFLTVATDGESLTMVDAPTGDVTGTGVAAQVTFWDDTSSITSDAMLVVDDTNKVLKIIIPTENASGGISIDQKGITGGGSLQFLDDGVYKAQIVYDVTDGDLTLNSNGDIKITPTGDTVLSGGTPIVEHVRITSGGDVGIGTDSPLTINGNAAAGSGLHVNSSSSYGVSVLDGADGSQMFFNDRGALVNSRLWRLLCKDGSFSIYAMNDNIGVKSSALTISSTGVATFSNDIDTPTVRQGGEIMISRGSNIVRVGSGSGSDSLAFYAGGSQRMSISSEGQVYMNTTSSIGTGVLSIKLGGTNKLLGIRFRAATSGNYATAYENSSGTIIGKIIMNASSTSYETTSDYRLKENVTPITDALSRVNQLKPSRFNFIIDADKIVDGFLAHEVQDIIPEAISGEKDAMKDEEYEVTPRVDEVTDEEGNVITEAVEAVMETRSIPDYQGIDQSKIVPLLTAAIQEQQTIIDSLIIRLEALEA